MSRIDTSEFLRGSSGQTRPMMDYTFLCGRMGTHLGPTLEAMNQALASPR
ncbi:hypothetical protein HS125_11535 [bacterium]|nr:hypothetical protein [bacterium]